jgi:hypothetical protein
MTLYDQIIKLYPSLTKDDFDPIKGTIYLQNDGDGDYIKMWANSNPQPTKDELNTVID